MTFSRHALLIDTDIGDDVDDAFALALAAVHPALRICGVTTVSGPTALRAQIATTILQAAGQESVPVVAGRSAMSTNRPGSARFSHAPLLDMAQNTADQRNHLSDGARAADLILEWSHRESSLTVVTLGPLTNIAEAIVRDPTLAQRVRLVAMAGAPGLPYPDWNLRCDPAAARVVLESTMPITLIGMDLTMRCKLRPPQMNHLFAARHPLATVLGRCVIAWRTWKRRMPILHDALAVATVAESDLVTVAPRTVHILPWGFSTTRRGGRANALVGTAVDIERFHTVIERYLLNTTRPLRRPHTSIERLIQRIM